MIDAWQTFSFSGKSENCYGLEVVKHGLQARGIKCDSYSAIDKKPVLVSLYWPEQLYNYLRWRYSAANQGRTVLVGGNYATTSPNALMPYDTAVFMGDGELFDGSLDNPYIAVNTPRAKAVSKHIAPTAYFDAQSNYRSFCEISRGCKNKCMFCQYTWLKPYREASLTDIEIVCRKAKTKSIRVFAADRFAHTRYPAIRALLQSIGKNDTGSDVSMRLVFKNPEYLQYTNKVRVGIEGCSERLRKLVGKPFSDDNIAQFCKMVADAGIKTLDWYMIYGLPTETGDDRLQFIELLKKVDAVMPEGYALAIHWNAFTPNAQTPFQWAAPAQGPECYPELTALFDNRDITPRMKVYHKPRLTSMWTITRRILAIRGDERLKNLIYTFATKESAFKKKPREFFRLVEREAGRDMFGEWPVDTPMPWDRHCIYRKDLMLKLWNSRVLRHAEAIA